MKANATLVPLISMLLSFLLLVLSAFFEAYGLFLMLSLFMLFAVCLYAATYFRRR